MNNPVVEINVGSICFNIEMLKNFTFFYDAILCYDNAVLTVWLGLGTNYIWLGEGKDHALA